MEKIVSIVIYVAFVFIAFTTNAQTVEFNHKTGKYLEVDDANNKYPQMFETITKEFLNK